MATKTTTTNTQDTLDTVPGEQPFDLLAALARPSANRTTEASLGDTIVAVQTSWTGAEAAAVSTAMAGSLEDVTRALIPDDGQADAAWAFIGNLRQDVALIVVQEMLKLSGLATDEGFLARSASSETPEGGAER